MPGPVDVGTTIGGRYRVEREIGRGGMATVYLARDSRHDRMVAVKVLHPELTQAVGAERFQREIAITANLTHPNILPLHDSGEHDGSLYYVMPWVAGESLRDRLLRDHQLPLREVIAIGRGVAAALEHAHARGVVHRDIKPDNILLADGQAIVADFGIARAVQAGASETLTASGVSLGTPAYMSPEQASGEQGLDGRSDLYSLSCVLYEAIAGELPFTGGTAQAVIAKRFTGPAPDVRQARGTVPECLADVISCGLAQAPADRFQTATEFRQALEAVEQECTQSVTGSATGRKGRARRRRTRQLTAAGVVIAAVLAGALIYRYGPETGFAGTRETTSIRTIAVLPLANFSGDMAQDYIGDGLTDAIITGLAQLDSLNVISRTSVMQYKMMPKPLPEIARELRADALVEASFARQGDRVRVNAKLVRASDQQAMWAGEFERPFGDALGLQRDIALAVAGEIGARLIAPAARSAARRPVKPEAQEHFYKGVYYYKQGRTKDATVMLQRAVDVDPTHVEAYAALARAQYFGALFGGIAPAEAFSQMRRAAERAIELDPVSAEGYGLLALVATHYDWDFALAERHFARALALNPNNAEVRHDYAHFLLAMGRDRESAEQTALARRLDPANPMLTACVGWHSLFDGQYDAAARYARDAQMMMPSFWAQMILGWAHLGRAQTDSGIAALRTAAKLSEGLPFARAALAHGLATGGQEAEARRILDELLQASLRGYVSAYDVAVVHAGLGDTDRAIEWLRKALGERSVLVVHLAWDTRLQGLRKDPRFIELVKQLGVTKAAGAPQAAS